MNCERQGSGPSVVLLHGLGASLFSWRRVVAALSAGGFTAYAVDLVGFGGTLAPGGFEYTMAAQAKAVRDFINAEGIANPILIGHSLGGGVCLHLAEMASHTVPAPKMVLIAAVAYPPIRKFPRIQEFVRPGPMGAPLRLPESLAHVMAAFFLSRAYAQENQPSLEQINGYAAGLSSPGQLHAFTGHSMSLITIEEPLPSFAGIVNETLIVWGDQETILPPSDGSRLSNALPSATLHSISNSGHIPHEEQPADTIKAIMEFL